MCHAVILEGAALECDETDVENTWNQREIYVELCWGAGELEEVAERRGKCIELLPLLSERGAEGRCGEAALLCPPADATGGVTG